MRLLGISVVVLAITSLAVAQPRSSATDVVVRWAERNGQAEAWLEGVDLRERVERRIHGPHAERVVEASYDLEAQNRRVIRRLQQATIDGEPIDPDRVQHHLDRTDRVFGTELRLAHGVAVWPRRYFGRLQVERIIRERADGRDLVRAELTPPRRDTTIEQTTAWFTNDENPSLVRTRVVVSGHREGSTLTIVTHYGVLRGPGGVLAVPQRQEVEAVLRQQRRWRTYTVLIHSESTFDQIRPRWRQEAARRR